jgi:hypothetical protein
MVLSIQWLFIMVNRPEKFQPKKIKGESSSFANWKSGQNLQMDVVLKIWSMELGFLMEMVKICIGEAPQIIWDFSWLPKW